MLTRLRPEVEAIELPDGYALDWEGEYGDSKEANEGLAATLPMGFTAMVLVVFILFGTVRQPIVIWLVVPLALVGVVFGLLVTQLPMEFMAILGLLSLSGLLIKNAIVCWNYMYFERRLKRLVDPTEKQALIAELAGTAAHELNQPLTSVIGYGELLQRKLDEDSPERHAAKVIVREAERMADIVRKIGKITRYETKSYVGTQKIIDLDRSAGDGAEETP